MATLVEKPPNCGNYFLNFLGFLDLSGKLHELLARIEKSSGQTTVLQKSI